MPTKRSNRNQEDRLNALQNELEMLEDELDTNELQQEELRGLANSLEDRIEAIKDELDAGYTGDDQDEE